MRHVQADHAVPAEVERYHDRPANGSTTRCTTNRSTVASTWSSATGRRTSISGRSSWTTASPNNWEADQFFNFDRCAGTGGRVWMNPPFEHKVGQRERKHPHPDQRRRIAGRGPHRRPRYDPPLHQSQHRHPGGLETLQGAAFPPRRPGTQTGCGQAAERPSDNLATIHWALVVGP